MVKREDWELIKKFSKNNRNFAKIYSELPLVIIDKTLNNEINKQIIIDANNQPNVSQFDYIYTNMHNVLLDNFVCKCIDFNGRVIYFKLQVRSDNEGSKSITIQSNEEHQHGMIAGLQVFFNKMNDQVITHEQSFYLVPSIKGAEYYSFDKESVADANAEFLIAVISHTVAFFKAISESDLYPVEKRGTQNRHRPHIKHDKKPWARGDLSSIVFLNKLPTVQEQSESKGGHHASPRFHHRRGTWVHLKNERYKNHPKFGDKIYRKASWVGERETIINGTTYKVL